MPLQLFISPETNGCVQTSAFEQGSGWVMWTWKAEDVSSFYLSCYFRPMAVLGCGLDLPGRSRWRLDPSRPHRPQVPQHLRLDDFFLTSYRGRWNPFLHAHLRTVFERYDHELVLIPTIPHHGLRSSYIHSMRIPNCPRSLLIHHHT